MLDSDDLQELEIADTRGLLPDDYDLFGMLGATMANFSMSPPSSPLGPSDFRPRKRLTLEQRKDKEQRLAKGNESEVLRWPT